MNELIGAAVVVVVLAAVAFLGFGIIEKTYGAVNSTAPSTGLNDFHTSITSAMKTFGDLLPIVVIALVGGLAILYIVRYLGGTRTA